MATTIYTVDGNTIVKSMHTFLNTWPNKSVDIRLEGFTKNPPSMMLQQLARAVKKRAYVNGSYIGVWAFAVYVRINGTDTAGKFDAIAALEGLADWLNEKNTDKTFVNLPTLDNGNTAIKIEMTATPSIAASYGDGTIDYQAIFELNYKHKEEF